MPDLPPLFATLLGGQEAAALALLRVPGPEAPLHAPPPAAAAAAASPVLPGGLTVLHAAALGGCALAARLLISAGAAVDTPLGRQHELWRTSLRARDACPPGPLATLLHEGSTPLCCAAQMARPRCAAVLLEAGADPCARDQLGHTPLGWAADRSRHGAPAVAAAAAEMAAALLEAGADPLAPFFGAVPNATILEYSGAAAGPQLRSLMRWHAAGQCQLGDADLAAVLRARLGGGPRWVQVGLPAVALAIA